MVAKDFWDVALAEEVCVVEATGETPPEGNDAGLVSADAELVRSADEVLEDRVMINAIENFLVRPSGVWVITVTRYVPSAWSTGTVPEIVWSWGEEFGSALISIKFWPSGAARLTTVSLVASRMMLLASNAKVWPRFREKYLSMGAKSASADVELAGEVLVWLPEGSTAGDVVKTGGEPGDEDDEPGGRTPGDVGSAGVEDLELDRETTWMFTKTSYTTPLLSRAWNCTTMTVPGGVLGGTVPEMKESAETHGTAGETVAPLGT
ncbi:unnamed protein product [Discula destructiva]